MALPDSILAALPVGVPLPIPGRGHMRVSDIGPDTDGPAVLLLHGWNIDGPSNWGHAVAALAEQHRVIVIDHHGHGGGVRPDAGFRLEHCAVDAICALDQLGVEEFVAVGYSMGGAIAQLLAHRLPKRCVGWVALASSACFKQGRRDRAQFALLSGVASAARRVPRRALERVAVRVAALACRPYPDWVLEVVRAADPVSLVEAGAEIGRFDSRSWIGSLQQPASVVITTVDSIVTPEMQRQLAELSAAEVFEIDADHDLPLHDDPRFGETMRSATTSVLTRIASCSSASPDAPTSRLSSAR